MEEGCADNSGCGGELGDAAERPTAAASDALRCRGGGGCGTPDSGRPSAAAAALLAVDEAFEWKHCRPRAAVEVEPFGEWSTPAAPLQTSAAVAGGKKAAAGGRRTVAATARDSVSQRGGVLSEDEWLLRFRQPYWRAMVGCDGEYVVDNGCYRCMKLRSYPDELDVFAGSAGEQRPRADPGLRTGGSEPRQLQREVTRDLRRQFRLVVQSRESSTAEPETATAASKKNLITGLRHQAIAEAEGEDGDADTEVNHSTSVPGAPMLPPPPPPVELPISVARGTGAAPLGRTGGGASSSVARTFAPPLATDVLYELPTGGLSFLDECTAKDLVSLSRTLSRIPDFGSRLSFSERLLAIERATSNSGDVKAAAATQQALAKRSVPLALPPPPPPLREAFVLADDALRVKKISRRQDLRPVEKLTPKLRQLEDSTRLANTLAKLRYTTASGSVISLPVFASSSASRSHSASLPADSDAARAGAVVGMLASASAATAAAAAAAAVAHGQPQSAPPSPDNKKKMKGRRAEAKGFSLQDNGIQEMCLPEIAGVRIATLSGPHR